MMKCRNADSAITLMVLTDSNAKNGVGLNMDGLGIGERKGLMTMKCEKCGKQMHLIDLNVFDREGSDSDVPHLYKCEPDGDAVVIDTTPNWTGYEQSEEEMMERITCPHCGKFPFNHKEVQVYDIVRIVCFKSEKE